MHSFEWPGCLPLAYSFWGKTGCRCSSSNSMCHEARRWILLYIVVRPTNSRNFREIEKPFFELALKSGRLRCEDKEESILHCVLTALANKQLLVRREISRHPSTQFFAYLRLEFFGSVPVASQKYKKTSRPPLQGGSFHRPDTTRVCIDRHWERRLSVAAYGPTGVAIQGSNQSHSLDWSNSQMFWIGII